MIEWIDRINQLNIIVLGDVMLDRYIKGSVERVSPEAPVPIMTYEKTIIKLGGAANVALNLKRLGVMVNLLGVIGNDQEGSDLKNICEHHGIPTSDIFIVKSRPTTLKTRYMAGQQHLLRVDKESTAPILNSVKDKLISSIRELISNERINILIFQDYDKGVLDQELVDEVISICRSKNILTMADPKHKNFWAYHHVNLFKPNVNECAQALNISTQEVKTNLIDTTKTIQSRLNNQLSLITLGKDGLFITDGKTDHFETGIQVEAADVCGAGDTVISVAACALGCGLSIKEVAKWSNKAAAWACTRSGVVSLSTAQLRELGS